MAQETMPGEVSPKQGVFDRFAEWVSSVTARAWFFTGCVALVLGWVPTLVLLPLDTSQLIINTATTIITFLLVALFQNSTMRSDKATQQKLNALASSNLRLLQVLGHEDVTEAQQLRAAVGVEQRESAG